MTPWSALMKEWKRLNPQREAGDTQRMARQCFKKYAYPNFLHAMLAANRSPSAYRGENLAVYECELCHRLHFGHSNIAPSIAVDRQFVRTA